MPFETNCSRLCLLVSLSRYQRLRVPSWGQIFMSHQVRLYLLDAWLLALILVCIWSKRIFIGIKGGGYTQIHQDGHGTVDSGHTCICGFNEIIISRRLPEQHKLRACSMIPSRESVGPEQQAKNMLYRLPHDDGREDKPSWPTKASIDEMNKMKWALEFIFLAVMCTSPHALFAPSLLSTATV